MVTISFTTPDPELSARLANAHAREYISWGIEINAHESEEAEHFLEGKLAQIKEQLEASEAAVNRYRRDKGIVPGLISVNGKGGRGAGPSEQAQRRPAGSPSADHLAGNAGVDDQGGPTGCASGGDRKRPGTETQGGTRQRRGRIRNAFGQVQARLSADAATGAQDQGDARCS